MPRRSPAIPTDAVQLRQLQVVLSDLSVAALLRVRDAADRALARDLVRPADVAAVVRAATARS